MTDLAAEARGLVSPERLADTVEKLCGLGEKVSGSAEEEAACRIITDALAAAGIEHRVHVFESYISYPRATRLVVHAGEEYELPAVGVAFGLSAPPEGFSAEVVLVGTGVEADYAGKDVAGKIVAMTTLPSPSNAVVAAAKGARGMICMSAGKQRHKMIITPVWGTPEFDQVNDIPRLHVTSISRRDGERLLADLKRGRVTATQFTDVFEGWRKVRLPEAVIHGEEPLFSLVGAHYCSWFDGSTDNVTGDACVLELARVLKRFEGKLRYGFRFCWWPGHSHGRYSGSTWYADSFRRELFENGIVYFNIDSPGVRGATIYVPRHQMAEISAYNERMTREITGWTPVKSADAQLSLGKRADKYVSPTRPARAADQSFWGVGLTSMSVYSMLTPDHPDRDSQVGGSGGAWWWHSEHETLDKFDPAILAQDTRLYASSLLGLATAELLPFDFSETAKDYLDSLREYDEAAGDLLPIRPLMAEVEAFGVAVAALRRKALALNDRAASGRVNRLFLGLARTLNPVLYHQRSPFEHDPALGARHLPGLAPALTLKALPEGSDARKFAVVGLGRRLAAVAHQVREASRLVAQFE